MGKHWSLKNLTAENWMMAAELALRQASKRSRSIVIVIGFSMGGIIAIYLANRYKIEKLVLLSAAAKYIYPAQLLQDIREIAKEAYVGKLEENNLFKRYKYKWEKTPITCDI